MPNTYKITYNLNGGSGDSLGSYTYGVGLVLPDNPTKTNYAFAGWYYGDELVTAISATEIGDKEFFAKWKLNTYTVIFNTNGGTQINPLTNVEHGIAIQEPPEPAKDGYIFIGWYLGENPVSFPITITADITLYVKWVDEPDNLEYAINITSPGFEKNEALSNDSTVYFTASATLCEVEETDIEITLNDKYVGLEMGGALLANGVPDGEGGIKYSKHVILRHKGGLDTLKYKLHKNNGLMEHNSIIIATPFPFDSIVKQKWNNVFVVNNNPATNGGYRFTQFKWFKNGKETSNTLQYFSAGPRSTDLLNPSDDFTVQVSTEDGVKINSCIGHPKISEENPAFQKQVLGIGKNNPPPDSEVYTTKGERSTGKTPGVYIIRRSSK
ncbi:MAG: InlB B-repeat-containing protein, partial [Fibromonadales bacterium]|nr:InlB B-repeat-containing protein [Fibromonadales bacterium]